MVLMKVSKEERYYIFKKSGGAILNFTARRIDKIASIEGLGQAIGVLGQEVRGLLVVGFVQGVAEGVEGEDQFALGRRRDAFLFHRLYLAFPWYRGYMREPASRLSE